MNNLSTAASIDISSQIGALELGANLESHGDDMLEMAGAGLQGPTQPISVLRCVGDDGALESAGLPLIGGYTYQFACTQMGRCVSDGALLSAADTAVSNPPTAFSGGSGRCF